MSAQRDITQDIVKGIAIVLVVYGHMARGLIDADPKNIPPVLAIVDYAIYTTHMPLFFLLSGLNIVTTFNRSSVSRFAQSRFWSLVYPYLVWSFILWAMKLVTTVFFDVNHPVSAIDILRIFWEPIGPLWFLYALLLMQASYAAARGNVKILWVLAVTATLIASHSESFPYLVSQTMVHFPYFVLGATLSYWPSQTLWRLCQNWKLILTAIATYTLSIYVLRNVHEYAPVGLYSTSATISGILVIAASGVCLSGSRFGSIAAYVGRLSVPIFVMHVIFTALSRIALTKLGLNDLWLLLAVGTSLGVALPIIVYMAASKLKIADLMALTGKAVPTPRHANVLPEFAEKGGETWRGGPPAPRTPVSD